MRTEDKLLEVKAAVAELGGRFPFLKNEDQAWRLIRTNQIPAVRIGRRVYLSVTQIVEHCAKGGTPKVGEAK